MKYYYLRPFISVVNSMLQILTPFKKLCPYVAIKRENGDWRNLKGKF
jgi:hypothetical protein